MRIAIIGSNVYMNWKDSNVTTLIDAFLHEGIGSIDRRYSMDLSKSFRFACEEESFGQRKCFDEIERRVCFFFKRNSSSIYKVPDTIVQRQDLDDKGHNEIQQKRSKWRWRWRRFFDQTNNTEKTLIFVSRRIGQWLKIKIKHKENNDDKKEFYLEKCPEMRKRNRFETNFRGEIVIRFLIRMNSTGSIIIIILLGWNIFSYWIRNQFNIRHDCKINSFVMHFSSLLKWTKSNRIPMEKKDFWTKEKQRDSRFVFSLSSMIFIEILKKRKENWFEFQIESFSSLESLEKNQCFDEDLSSIVHSFHQVHLSKDARRRKNNDFLLSFSKWRQKELFLWPNLRSIVNREFSFDKFHRIETFETKIKSMRQFGMRRRRRRRRKTDEIICIF